MPMLWPSVPEPPSRSGWLGGGMRPLLDGVEPPPLPPPLALPPAAPALGDREIAAFISSWLSMAAPPLRDCEPPEATSAVVNSRCSGEVWLGEVDFFEWPSPLPPREEFRGDTLPVCDEAQSWMPLVAER